jgi:NAD(P)H-dependent FMN reductase
MSALGSNVQAAGERFPKEFNEQSGNICPMENTVRIALISGSLNPDSLSRQMAQHAEKTLKGAGADVDFIDLQEIQLPMCDGDSAYSDPKVERTRSRIESAAGILIAAPVYNFYLNAAVKNLIELTGSAWEDKVVGFLNAAGGYSSYMSVMSVANSLMLDFRCVIVPRFVYAVGSAFRDGAVSDGKVAERIDKLANELVRFASRLSA